MADGFVSVSRHIEVPAERLFALVADPANHPLFDGSGHGAGSRLTGVTVSGAGDAFRDEHAPRPSGATTRCAARWSSTRPDAGWCGSPRGWKSPAPSRRGRCARAGPATDGDSSSSPDGRRSATTVTESFDCTRSPTPTCGRPPGRAEGWRDAMTASLVKLELLAKATRAA